MEKTLQEIGYEYELYIGARYEANGFEVDYCGIREKIFDNGRDLICKKNGKVYIVQCKRYRADKVIHYDVVDRIYATAIRYAKENQLLVDDVIPVVVTSSKLAYDALESARALGVEVRENVFFSQDDFIRLRMQIAEKKTMLSERHLDDALKKAEEKLLIAESKTEEAEQKVKIAIMRAKKAEDMALNAEKAMNEAEDKAKRYKIAQLASLEKAKDVLHELEVTKTEAEQRIKKEISARLKAEANSKKTVEEIENEIAAITARIEHDANTKIEAIRNAAQNEINIAKQRVKAAELEKSAAEEIAKEAEKEKLAEIKKSKAAQAEAKKMSAVAEDAVKYAEKAHEDLVLKSGDIEKAITNSKNAEERMKQAETDTKAAEYRAYEAEHKLKKAIDETNQLKLLLLEKENELKNKFEEEIKLRESIQLRKIEVLEYRLKKEQEENISKEERKITRREQTELWLRASGESQNNEIDDLLFEKVKNKRQEARLAVELKLNEIDKKLATSKLLARKINLYVDKVSYSRGNFNIYFRIQNDNAFDICLNDLTLNLVLHHKSTGVKLFESTYDIQGPLVSRYSIIKTKSAVKENKFYYADGNFSNKILDCSASNIIVKFASVDNEQ